MLVVFPAHHSSSLLFIIIIIIILLFLLAFFIICVHVHYHSLMASLVSPILDLFIVVHYLLVKARFSLVNKTKKAWYTACLSIGYGQFAHAILSL